MRLPKSAPLAVLDEELGSHVLAPRREHGGAGDHLAVERFANGVNSTGASFVVLVMPKRKDLEYAMANGVFPYEAILAAAPKSMQIVRSDKRLLEAAQSVNVQSLFLRLHYSPKGNDIVANDLVDQLEMLSLLQKPSTRNTVPNRSRVD